MSYSETLKRLKEYLEMDSFGIDDECVSIYYLKQFIEEKIIEPFRISYLKDSINMTIKDLNSHINKVFNGSKIDRIGFNINDKSTALDLYFRKYKKPTFTISLKKDRNSSDIYIEVEKHNTKANMSQLYSDCSIIGTFEKIIMNTLSSLEKIYDCLENELDMEPGEYVSSLSDFELLHGFIKAESDIFNISLNLLADGLSTSISFKDIKNNRHFLNREDLTQLLQESKDHLEHILKVKILDLPVKLQLLVKDELKKLKDIKKLEKSI